MTYLRHAPRHVLATIAKHVETGLTGLGWLDQSPSQRPFTAPRVQVSTGSAWAEGRLRNDVKPGQVYVSLGPEFTPLDEELGGPLASQEYPIFCDVFMDAEGTALALASDIRDWFLGRIAPARRSIKLVDQVTGDDVADWLLEFSDIERHRPDTVHPVHWQVVNATATAYFPESVGVVL